MVALSLVLPAIDAQESPPAAKSAPPAKSAPKPPGKASPKGLIDQEPFDRLTLDEANDNSVIKVRPIPFPGRKVPEKPKSTDKLRVKLFEDSRDYEVAWKNVAKVELFERMVLDELQQLIQQGMFDDAYAHLVFLRSNYGLMEGLDAAHNGYLYQAAGGAFRQQKYAEALGILEELHRRSPQYQTSAAAPTLVQVLGNTADKLIGEYVAKEDFRSARTLLQRLTKKYSARQEPFAVKWREKLSGDAAQKRDAARESLTRGEFIAAYDAYSEMLNIWPDVEGGPELAAEMARRYPLVKVGVSEPALQHDARSLANPAARRTGRLVERKLFEYLGMGPEGGQYLCPFGDVETSDDGLEITFRLRRPSEPISVAAPTSSDSSPRQLLNGYDLSRLLLAPSADKANTHPPWERLISAVQVKDVWQVNAQLRLPHVRPQAMLQNVIPSSDTEATTAGNGPYYVLSRTEQLTRYTANEHYPFALQGQPAEVDERVFDDPQRGVIALRRGEIDVLDRVFPGDVAELKADSALIVDSLGVPTTHTLVVRRHNAFLDNRTFRRALVYGCDREKILKQAILRGGKLPGFRVVSAPFAAPTSSGDSVAYGYDERIESRPYDPRLALTLKVLGQREVKASFEKRELQPPELSKLSLAHPADEVARIACRAFAAQWKLLGIDCDLVELPPGVFVDEDRKHDLLYVLGQTGEPVVDAGRLFDAGGLASTENGFIRLCVRQIETASNWQQARQHLQDLHRLVHEDVTVMPLWQTYDHFAYRAQLQGIGSQPATLYQNIEQWRMSPQVAN